MPRGPFSWRAVAAVLAAMGAAAAQYPCITDVSAGLHKRAECSSVRIPAAWGHNIRVTYNVPSRCLASSCGLVVDVHGGAMDAVQEDANTNMVALGEQHGYIVVQPIAPPGKIPVNNWGLAPWGAICNASDAAVFDWVQQALAVDEWNIDRARLHFMGFSEGGHMTWRMLLRYPGVFASAVVIEAAEPDAGFFPADMTQVPILAQGGVYDVPEPYAQHLKTWENLRQVWGAGAGVYVAGDGHWNRTRYVGRAGAPFETIVHPYAADYVLAGHCFPGGNDTWLVNAHEIPFVGPFSCPGALSRKKAGYVIGDEAMKWFLAHPKGV